MHAGHLDWITFSVDASSDAIHAAMGRGMPREVTHGAERHGSKDARAYSDGSLTATTGGGGAGDSSANRHLARVRHLWPLARELGFRLKLNTVVSALNAHDDMTHVVGELRPERWKVFQASKRG